MNRFLASAKISRHGARMSIRVEFSVNRRRYIFLFFSRNGSFRSNQVLASPQILDLLGSAMRRLTLLTFASLFVSTLYLSSAVDAFAEKMNAASPIELLEKRIEAQEAELQQLRDSLKELKSAVKEQKSAASSVPQVSYNKGFQISDQSDENSYSMKINGRMQFRYTGFARRNRTYRLDNGASGEQRDLNDFEIERGRLAFEGHILRPELGYYINFDFDTDDNHDVKAHDFWFSYDFDPALTLYAGKAFVPGSREWIEGSTSTMFSDRSLATSFFRPDRSLGLWAIGEPVENFHYRAMLANGFQTTDLSRSEVDDQFTYSASFWATPLGDFGKGRSALDWHESPVIRVGTSFTYSPIDESQAGEPLDEAGKIRLSDGMPVVGLPDDDVRELDLYLYALDFGMKYQRLALHSELYFRKLENLKLSNGGTLPGFTDIGVTTDLGFFWIERYLESVARFSYINGSLSDSAEYGLGLNLYIDGGHLNKLTLDVSRLDGSPVRSSGPNYFVGATGILYRLQWQVGF